MASRRFTLESNATAWSFICKPRAKLKRQPGQGAVNVFVTDVDALYRELRSRGARNIERAKGLPLRYA